MKNAAIALVLAVLSACAGHPIHVEISGSQQSQKRGALGGPPGGGFVPPTKMGGGGTTYTAGAGISIVGTTISATGSSFSTLNVLPKGDGTGLASSKWTDDGTFSGYNIDDIDGIYPFTVDTSGNGYFDGQLEVNNDLYADGSIYANGDIYGAAIDASGNLTVGSGPKFQVTASNGNVMTLGSLNVHGGSTLGDDPASDGVLAFGQSTFYADQTVPGFLGGVGFVVGDTHGVGTATGVGGGIGFRGVYDGAGSSIVGASIKAAKTNTTAGNYSFDLVFGTTANGGSNPTERMRIRDDGGITFNGTTGADGYVLTVDPTTHIPKWAATSGGISGLTTNKVVKATSGTTIGDGWASDDGTTWGVASKFTITEATGAFRSYSTGQVDGAMVLAGTLDARGAVSNSTGTIALSDDVDFGASTSSVLSFSNGPKGVNLYSGKHLDWATEWMGTIFNQAQGGVDGTWSIGVVGTGATLQGYTTGIQGRPGILEVVSGTTSTGRANIQTNAGALDFDEGTWTFEETFQYPTLSTSAEEYNSLVGFADNAGNNGQVDGCFYIYDQGNALSTSGGVNPGKADKFQACTASGSTRSCVLLDGTSQNGSGGAGSITTVNTAVTAGSFVRAKVVASTGSCAFSMDTGSGMTLRTTMTINVPTAATGVVAGKIQKSAGTTSRSVYVDQTYFGVDFTSARSP